MIDVFVVLYSKTKPVSLSVTRTTYKANIPFSVLEGGATQRSIMLARSMANPLKFDGATEGAKINNVQYRKVWIVSKIVIHEDIVQKR